MRPFISSDIFTTYKTHRTGLQDVRLVFAALSFFIVVLSLYFHSILLGTFIVIIDLLVIVIGFIIYKKIFGFNYFDNSFSLSFPLTLGGASANAVGIFDAWRSSRQPGSPLDPTDLRGRMAALLKGMLSGGILGYTTAISAVVILGLNFDMIVFKAFTVHLLIMLTINLLVVDITFPPLLVFHEQYILIKEIKDK